jgi:hypothetical protein
MGLKRFSGPFDWIFSNLRMVADCIEDDFGAFLDREQIRPIPPENRASPITQHANHELYHRRYRIPGIFNHYDPTVPENYDYLARCVGRFRSVLASDKRQLLIAFSRRDQGGLHGFERLAAALADRKSIELLVFIVRENADEQRVTTWTEHGRHRLLNLYIQSQVGGLEFTGQADNSFAERLLREAITLSE